MKVDRCRKRTNAFKTNDRRSPKTPPKWRQNAPTDNTTTGNPRHDPKTTMKSFVALVLVLLALVAVVLADNNTTNATNTSRYARRPSRLCPVCIQLTPPTSSSQPHDHLAHDERLHEGRRVGHRRRLRCRRQLGPVKRPARVCVRRLFEERHWRAFLAIREVFCGGRRIEFNTRVPPTKERCLSSITSSHGSRRRRALGSFDHGKRVLLSACTTLAANDRVALKQLAIYDRGQRKLRPPGRKGERRRREKTGGGQQEKRSNRRF